MSRPQTVLVMGLLAAGAYVVASWAGARSGPASRRPILDGFAPPPPYNWVSPPPSLASGNHRPSGGKAVLGLDPAAGSVAEVVSTADGQVSLALARGAVAPRPGQDAVAVTITPLAPAPGAEVPPGLEIAGNVYRVTVAYRPSGAPVASLRRPAQLVMAYPVLSPSLVRRHTLLRSPDGRSWVAVGGTDVSAQQLVQGTVRQFGYFSVAQSATGTPRPRSITHVLTTVLLWAAVVVVVGGILVSEVRHRRARRRRRPRPGRHQVRGRGR